MILTRRALLGATALTFLAGCASEPEPPTTPGMPSIPPASGTQVPDGGAPEAEGTHGAQERAAITALAVMTTWHTGTDDTQTAADLRARPYYTEELATSIRSPARNGAAGEWFAHPNSTSIPQVIQVQETDSVVPGSLAFEVTWDWSDAEGELAPGASVRLYNLAMANTPAGWKISDYTYEEYPRHS